MGSGLVISIPPSYEILPDEDKALWARRYKLLTEELDMSSQQAIVELDRQWRVAAIMSNIHPCKDEKEACLDKSLCPHPYFNKWEGEYICMDCWTKLSPTDPTHIAIIEAEESKEAKTPSDSIPANMHGEELKSYIGKMSQQRGVSIGFLLAFTKKFDCWDKSSWWIIRHIIKPLTESRRCRFMELDWMGNGGYVGPAHTFISYAQQGSWGDLVAAVLDGGADLNRKVWLDIFAVRQWPSDSPDLDFASTIAHCSSFLCVCSYLKFVANMCVEDTFSRNSDMIPANDRKKIAFLRVWCLVEIAAAAEKPDMPRIMKCGQHKIGRLGDMSIVSFSSEAGIFGIFGSLIDINKAEATVESDKRRILYDIEGKLTIEHVNHIVRGILLGGGGIAKQGTLGSIIQCAACGDPEAMQYILSEPDKSLVAAASGGYLSLVELLLGRGALADSKDKDGVTALIAASAGGHSSCIELLLGRGADVNFKLFYVGDDDPTFSRDGMTALMAASFGGHTECVKILLERGADINAKVQDGSTALMAASNGGHASCIKLLLERGADINAKNSFGFVAMIGAATQGHTACVELLLDKGAAVDTKAHLGMTALMLASYYDRISTIQLLLDRGASVDTKNEEGMTALTFASQLGHRECVQLLLSRGATAEE